MYILRNGGFIDVKKLFVNINGYQVNVGRGGAQKTHILSPLDFRLSSYLLAMFNCNYGKVAYLNAFNDLDKDRYLSYMEKDPNYTLKRIKGKRKRIKDKRKRIKDKNSKDIVTKKVNIRFVKSNSKKFRPIALKAMPTYCFNENLELSLYLLR